MTIQELQTRIARLVAQAKTALKNVIQHEDSLDSLKPDEWAALKAAGLSFIESTFGRDHSYYREFQNAMENSYESNGQYALGVLNAIQEQITNGWLETTKGLVTAEVFADFLEMAEHFLDQKYKDPAAVMVGSVLEEHLRQVCLAASIPTEDPSGKPRKADILNADLAKAGKYSKLDQKQVTAWLDLRNKAAHGKYYEYSNEQVVLMLAGVRDFIIRGRP